MQVAAVLDLMPSSNLKPENEDEVSARASLLLRMLTFAASNNPGLDVSLAYKSVTAQDRLQNLFAATMFFLRVDSIGLNASAR